jgi:branched-chain amino acid transport system substrate-binding protein
MLTRHKALLISVAAFTLLTWLSLAQAAMVKQPIRIGWFGPLTGARAFDGQQALKGAEFAFKVINQQGGVLNRPLELVKYDSRGEKTEAIVIARRLSDRDQVVAVLGGDGSVASVAAAPVFNEKKVPLLVTYASAYSIVKGKPWVFRWGQEADVIGAVMANFIAQDLKAVRIAVLVQDEEYGRGVNNGLQETLKKTGRQVVYTKFFPVTTRDFRHLLTEIKSVNADAIVGTGFGTTHVSIVKQGTDIGLLPTVKYVAPCTISEIGWFNAMGPEAEKIAGAMEFSHGTDTPGMKDFLAHWGREHPGLIPDHYAALNYESVLLLADAITRGGASREGIRKALAGTQNFVTVDGRTVKMTATREVLRPMFLGEYDAKEKVFRLNRWEKDPALLDPVPWDKYYR